MFENTQSLQRYRSYLASKLNPVERFADLFSGRDDRQDFANLLLYELLQVNSSLAAILAGGSGGTGGNGGSGGSPITFPRLGIKTVEVINKASVSTNELKPNRMANVQTANRVLVYVVNGFNQEITVKVVGNTSDSVDGTYEIGSFRVAAGEKGSYGLKLEEWLPFIACTVTPSSNPAAGTVQGSVITQEAV